MLGFDVRVDDLEVELLAEKLDEFLVGLVHADFSLDEEWGSVWEGEDEVWVGVGVLVGLEAVCFEPALKPEVVFAEHEGGVGWDGVGDEGGCGAGGGEEDFEGLEGELVTCGGFDAAFCLFRCGWVESFCAVEGEQVVESGEGVCIDVVRLAVHVVVGEGTGGIDGLVEFVEFLWGEGFSGTVLVGEDEVAFPDDLDGLVGGSDEGLPLVDAEAAVFEAVIHVSGVFRVDGADLVGVWVGGGPFEFLDVDAGEGDAVFHAPCEGLGGDGVLFFDVLLGVGGGHGGSFHLMT